MALLFATFAVVTAQIVGGKGGKVKDPPPSGPAPSRRSNVVIKPVIRTVIERVTPTTGSLSVAAKANATILVEPIKIRNAQGQQGVVPPNEGLFLFVDLKPGRYRVAGTLAGHQPVETEVVIAANKSQKATLNFVPILYSVVINTNVSGGELMYGPEGQPLSNVATIQNKSVQLDLPAGTYDVGIRAADFGYETLRASFSLTSDKTVLNMPLRKIVMTTDPLSPSWTKAEMQTWEMPLAWQPDSRKNLIVKGAGVALPPEQFRYYQDFKLSSSAKMLNGVALSFVLRAADKQNYYLLQLTGEKSDEPYTLRLYVVKNGAEQRLRGIPISRMGAKAMGSGQFFAVSIKMIDFAITVEIEDSETGAPYTLGVLTDPAKHFPVGAVGIAGRANEENVIGRFVVCTGKCLSE